MAHGAWWVCAKISPYDTVGPSSHTVFNQVHDPFLHFRRSAVVWRIPGILLCKHFSQTTRNSPLTVFSRTTFRNMPRVILAGLAPSRPSYYLPEVYPPESYLMKGPIILFSVLI